MPGWGLSDGGADDSAESLSDPDESYAHTRTHTHNFTWKSLKIVILVTPFIRYAVRYHSILPSTYSTVNRFERSLFRREFRVAANKLRFSLFNVF